MLIAIPVLGETLNPHFGQSEIFAFIKANPDTKEILSVEIKPSPEQMHGSIPPWLIEQGVTHVIAGGMGDHMKKFLAQQMILVVLGAPCAKPVELAQQLLNNALFSTEPTSPCKCSCSH